MKRKTLLLPFIIYNSNIKYFFRIMRISLFPPHPFYFHMLHAGIVFAYRWG